MVEDEVDHLEKRKKVLECDIANLTRMSEKYADEAEAKGGKTSHSILVKSNALRYSAKQKKGELQLLDREIEDKAKSLPGMS